MFYFDHYVIDWEKVQTIEDIKRVLAALNIAFEPNSPALKSVMDLVRQERKQGY